MPSVLITPAAEEDLINIWIYIARDNEEAADRVYKAAENTFELLADFPGIGTPYHPRRTQLKGVRFFQIKNFTVTSLTIEKNKKVLKSSVFYIPICKSTPA